MVAALLLVAVSSAAGPANRSRSAADILQRDFFSWYGLWDCAVYAEAKVAQPTGNWWNCANSLEALANEVEYTGNTTYASVFSRTWYSTAAQYPIHKAFDGIDDIQWWALAWLRVSEVTGDAKFLSRSRAIFDEVLKYWDDSCGGGVWWNRKRTYKNAITNELFITLAVSLHKMQGATNSSYLEWAKRGWRWFNASAMITADGIVDGLGGAPSCGPTGKKYTYNQGVILSGLALLYEIDGDTAYRDSATRIADTALRTFSSGNIFTEVCPIESLLTDCEQFKGVFVRHLGYLATKLPPGSRSRYQAWLDLNAASLLANATDAKGAFSREWGGPVGSADGITHTAGLDLLNAALVASNSSRG